MHSKSVGLTITHIGAVICLGIVLAALPADARSGSNHSINLAGQQRMLIEQMTNGTMLAVLGIDTRDNIRALRSARGLFTQTLTGLRDGDDELGLRPTSTPEVLVELDRIDAHWPRYDQTLQTIVTSVMTSAEIDHSHIRELSDIQSLIIGDIDRTVDAFQHYAHGGEGHSILSTTINGAGQLRTFSQEIVGAVLAIAYQFDAQTNRERLGDTVGSLDRTLNGLVHGDGELRLLPAATPEIRAELAHVEEQWSEIKPLLGPIVSGGAVDEQSISHISRAVTRMMRPLNAVTLMYENL